jgi:hypothetical protein
MSVQGDSFLQGFLNFQDVGLTFDRLILQRAGFKFEYLTGIYFNKEGKIYRIIYDFAWMDFSDQSVLVVRKK